MHFVIRHFMRGRVRLFAPSLCRKGTLADAALAWLCGQSAVKRARINYDCACLIVDYDFPREDMLRFLLGRLRLMDLSDLRMLVAPALANGEAHPHAAAEILNSPPLAPHRFPLVLPTISLALTFTLNPVLRAINVPLMLWNAYREFCRCWRRHETRRASDA